MIVPRLCLILLLVQIWKKIGTTEDNLASHCLHGEHLVFLIYFVCLWFSLSFSVFFAIVSVCFYQSDSLFLSCLNFFIPSWFNIGNLCASKNLLWDFPTQWNVFQDKIWWCLNFICNCCNGSLLLLILLNWSFLSYVWSVWLKPCQSYLVKEMTLYWFFIVYFVSCVMNVCPDINYFASATWGLPCSPYSKL